MLYVYRQSRLIGNIGNDSQLSFTDIENDNPENTTYSLTAVYAEGESEPVKAKTTTISVDETSSRNLQINVYGRRIIVENPAAENITICDAAGRSIVAGNRDYLISVEVAPGLYLVNGKTTTAKIMVK